MRAGHDSTGWTVVRGWLCGLEVALLGGWCHWSYPLCLFIMELWCGLKLAAEYIQSGVSWEVVWLRPRITSTFSKLGAIWQRPYCKPRLTASLPGLGSYSVCYSERWGLLPLVSSLWPLSWTTLQTKTDLHFCLVSSHLVEVTMQAEVSECLCWTSVILAGDTMHNEAVACVGFVDHWKSLQRETEVATTYGACGPWESL